jgi:hypothetical protein
VTFTSVEWIIGRACIVCRTTSSTRALPCFGFAPPHDHVTTERFTDPEAAATAWFGHRWELGLSSTQFVVRSESLFMLLPLTMRMTDAGSRSPWGRAATQVVQDRGVRVWKKPLSAIASREFWVADFGDVS